MDDVAGAIGFMLEKRAFSSCEVLCRQFWIGRATCLRILHNKSGLQRLHLR
jgi:hypothetical protein